MKPTSSSSAGPTSASPLCSTGSRAPGMPWSPMSGPDAGPHYGVGRLASGRTRGRYRGLEPEGKGVFVEMARQARTAIAEGDVIVLVTDAREGLTARTARSERSCGGSAGAYSSRSTRPRACNPHSRRSNSTKWGSVRRTRFPPSTGRGARPGRSRACRFPVEEESGEPAARSGSPSWVAPTPGNPRSSTRWSARSAW